VYRNGAFAKQVLAPTTSTVDIGVIQSSLYSYNVSAIDGVGNQSGMSNTVIINTPPCSSTSGGQYLWTRAFGGSTTSDEAIATATAVDSSGSVWVAGRVLGTVDFGGGPVTSRGLWDTFVVKYAANGTFLWAKRVGGTTMTFADGIAVDRSSNVIVTGSFGNWGAGRRTLGAGRGRRWVRVTSSW